MINLDGLVAWQGALTASWQEVWGSFLGVLPTVLGAIIVFTVGLLIAYWVKRLVLESLRLLQTEKLTKTAGIDKYLEKAEIKFTFIELIGTIVEWLIILIFFLAVVDMLGLSVVSQVLVSVLSYLPNVLAAVLIFAAGYVVGNVVDGLVRGALASVDLTIARPLGKLTKWTVLIVAFFAAVNELQIAQGLIATFFQGLTYTIVLVVGLSVGLGAKDLVSKILDDWYEKLKK